MQNYSTAYKGEGAISEWNEGNLKSMRLHEAQEMINFAKIDPLAHSPDGKRYNYEMWISGIEILYGEGAAKYSDKEMVECEQVKRVVDWKLKHKPIHEIIMIQKIKTRSQSVNINSENWECLKRCIEIYEQKVKFFNDKHGLSTRNITSQGLF